MYNKPTKAAVQGLCEPDRSQLVEGGSQDTGKDQDWAVLTQPGPNWWKAVVMTPERETHTQKKKLLTGTWS